MERILAGVDGSPSSHHSLRWAADVAARARFELMVVRVIEPAAAESRRDEALRHLEAWCAGLPARCAQREVAVAEDSDAAHALLEVAHARGADLLVVGSRGAGEVGCLHLGRVAHHLVHQSPVPVAIVAPGAAVTTNRLVVGHHGRTGSAASLAVAAELARRMDVPVTAVYTFDPTIGTDTELNVSEWQRRARAEVHAWAGPIESAGIPVDVHLDPDRDVDPVAAMEYALNEWPGSVAVVGVRDPDGRSAGRVPLQLVRQTDHAVILVPSSTAVEPGDGSEAGTQASHSAAQDR